MRIGAHVSAAGGIDKAIDRAQEIGAECIQLFGSGPQGWAYKPHPQANVEAFKRKAKATNIGPNFLHGVYLVNLAAERPDHLERSMTSLVNYMTLAHQLGISGVIFHVGSHKGAGYEQVFRQVVDALGKVLARSPGNTWLVLENSAGMGGSVGSKFQELGKILKAVGSPRLKVCLDTQHCYAAGYDVARKAGLEAVMAELEREVGLANLVAVHANDAKVPFESGVDRHENIGEGHIGTAGFETILSHPAFKDVPFYLEVPGFDGKGPDRENVERLKQVRDRALRKA